MTNSACDATIVTTFISLSHSLKLHLTAEGVETRGQLDLMHAHGCDEMQGYYCSKPVPAREFEQVLRKGRSPAMEFGDVAAWRVSCRKRR